MTQQYFQMENQRGCSLQAHQEPSWCLMILSISEDLLHLARLHHLHLMAQFLPRDVREYVISRLQSSEVEWMLSQEAFQDMVKLSAYPQTDTFMSLMNHRCPTFGSGRDQLQQGTQTHLWFHGTDGTICNCSLLCPQRFYLGCVQSSTPSKVKSC